MPIDIATVETTPPHRIRSVEDFCRRYRLGDEDTARLIRRFGHFAPEHALLMTATRTPDFR